MLSGPQTLNVQGMTDLFTHHYPKNDSHLNRCKDIPWPGCLGYGSKFVVWKCLISVSSFPGFPVPPRFTVRRERKDLLLCIFTPKD